MKGLFKINDLVTVIAVVLIAISFTLIDFSDLSWDKNYRSYVGLFFGILLAVMLVFRDRSKKSNE